MHVLSDLVNKHITVVGLGLTGRSCVRFLKSQQRDWNITIAAMDSRDNVKPESDIECCLGAWDETLLSKTDVIVLSPGIAKSTPHIAAAIEAGKHVIGDIELFALYLNAHSPRQSVVGVTGSNGKSTVVTLIHEIAQAAGLHSALGGNIGTPVLDLISPDIDLYILELSSFQLETTNSLVLESACILNVSEDHMDRYSSFDDYVKAKQKIYAQTKRAVYFQEDTNTYPLATSHVKGMGEHAQAISMSTKSEGWSLSSDGRSVCFQGEVLLSIDETKLAGTHNLLNIQAALAICLDVGIPLTVAVQAVKQFNGLAHRCQKVASIHGVTWINDSKATNAGATLAAIKGLLPTLQGKLYLLVGGDAKGADVSLLKPAFSSDVENVFCFGQDAALFTALAPNVTQVDSMNDAIRVAASIATEGDVVLLSPACASFDMFDSYIHRGECFVEAVEAVA